MWVGNLLARVIWTLTVLVSHTYRTRVRKMLPVEASVVMTDYPRRSGPTFWETRVVSFLPEPDTAEEDDYGRDPYETLIYIKSITELVSLVWGRLLIDKSDFLYVTMLYAIPIEEWERQVA